MRVLRVIFGLLLVTPVAEGVEESERISDFSLGFELLVAMGMPDLKGATWCRISPLIGSGPEIGIGSRQWRTPNPLECRGWALPKRMPESPQRFLIGTEERIGRSESWAKAHREFLKTSPLLRDRIANWGVESWAETSWKEDVDRILKHVERLQKTTPEHMTKEIGHLRKLAPFLVFATQLWQYGQVEDANVLAAVLFEAVDSSSDLIDLVIAMLAVQQWESAFNTFQVKPDWERYERDLERIVTGYSRGKAHLRELRRLLELVKSQAAFQTPMIREFPVGKEAIGQEILRTLTETPMVIDPRMLRGAWILKNFEGKPHSEFWSSLASEGADAIHIVCNLIGDPVLTQVWSRNGSDFYRYGKTYGDLDGYERRSFPTMPRPYTRGELARLILGGVVPDTLYSLLLEDGFAQEAQSAICEWCEGLPGKSRGALALTYLQERELMRQPTLDERRDVALAWLANSENTDDHAKVEGLLLECVKEMEASDSQWYKRFGQVQYYLRSRGEAARSFYEKILPVMESKLEEAVVDHPKHKVETDRARGVIAGLRSRFEGNLLPKMLADLNEGESWDELDSAVSQILLDGSAEETWPIVLKFVSETDNRAAKINLLGNMSFLPSVIAHGETSQTLEEVKQAILKPELSSLWLGLLEDETVYQHPERHWFYPSPQEIVMRLMDSFSAGVFNSEAMKSLYDRETFRQRLGEQARAIILNQEPPPWPSTASLDRARKERLIDDCERQTAQSFLVWYRELMEDERLYVFKHLWRGASRVPIHEARSHIGRIDITTESILQAYPWPDLLGKLFTYEDLVAVADRLRSVEVTSRAILQLTDGSLYEGAVFAEAPDVAVRGFYFNQMPKESVLQVMSGIKSFCWAPTGKSLRTPEDSKRLEAVFKKRRYLWWLNFYIKPLSAVDG